MGEFATPPTPQPTETMYTCCKDQMTEQECLDNYISGKPCTWLAPEDPMAIKFNTQCLGESLVANGPAPQLPGFTGDNPITDVCHPEEYDYGNEEKMAVKVDGRRMHGNTTQVQIVKFLAVAVMVLVLGGSSICVEEERRIDMNMSQIQIQFLELCNFYFIFLFVFCIDLIM